MATNALNEQLARIWRRRWIVAAILLAFVVVGAMSAFADSVTYSAKSALAAASQNRAPEQDAILAQGYADFFNDPAYQPTLRQRAQVPDSISFTATTALMSPLIYITATSTSSTGVQSAAASMATALRDTVNDAIRASRDEAIAAVRQPFDDIRAANGVIPEQALNQMQDRVSALTADTTNQLDVISLDSSVSTNSSSKGRSIALAAFAGLVVGCAVALVIGSLTRRVESAFDLHEKTGLVTLVEVPRADEHVRVQKFGQLANALVHGDISGPSVIAVSAPKATTLTGEVGWAIATHWQKRGVRVLVLDADFGRPGTGMGLAEYLSSAGGVDLEEVVRPSPRHAGVLEVVRGTNVLGIGGVARDRFASFLMELRERADLIVILSPAILDCVDAQVICASADDTVLLVEQSMSKTADIREVQRLIEQVDGSVVGAVLFAKGAGGKNGTRSGRRNASIDAGESINSTGDRPGVPDKASVDGT